MKVFPGFHVLWPIVLWAVGGASTLILNVIATWSGDANLLVKLAANLTLDPLLAAWADYFGVELTPLDRTGGGLGREHDVFPG